MAKLEINTINGNREVVKNILCLLYLSSNDPEKYAVVSAPSDFDPK